MGEMIKLNLDYPKDASRVASIPFGECGNHLIVYQYMCLQLERCGHRNTITMGDSSVAALDT
jgi:hypothetical protein